MVGIFQLVMLAFPGVSVGGGRFMIRWLLGEVFFAGSFFGWEKIEFQTPCCFFSENGFPTCWMKLLEPYLMLNFWVVVVWMNMEFSDHSEKTAIH